MSRVQWELPAKEKASYFVYNYLIKFDSSMYISKHKCIDSSIYPNGHAAPIKLCISSGMEGGDDHDHMDSIGL